MWSENANAIFVFSSVVSRSGSQSRKPSSVAQSVTSFQVIGVQGTRVVIAVFLLGQAVLPDSDTVSGHSVKVNSSLALSRKRCVVSNTYTLSLPMSSLPNTRTVASQPFGVLVVNVSRT